MAVIALYITCLVVSAGFLVGLFVLFGRHVSHYFVLLYVSAIIVCFGTLQSALAVNVQEALAGQQTVYLSSCFIMYFCMLCVAELCDFKIPTVVNVLCVALGAGFFFCVMTTEYTHLFYISAYVTDGGGFTKLVKEYGPLHAAQLVLLLVYALACIGIIVNSLRSRKTLSLTNTLGLLGVILVVLVVYILGRIFSFPFDVMPLAYVLMLGVLSLLLHRISRTDVDGYSYLAMQRDGRFDFVLFSKTGRFQGFGGRAGEWFPEVTELLIDDRLENPQSEFLRQAKEWVNGEGTNEERLFTCGDAVISATHQLVSERGYNMHCVMLMDDTMHQRYLELMKDYNQRLEQDVRAKTATLEAMQHDVLVGLASTVENRDANTGGHIQRTSDVIEVFVTHMLERAKKDGPDQGMSTLTLEVAEDIISAAPLHDLGKVGVPDAILNKPGKFTPEEYEAMKTHSEKGSAIVARILGNIDDTKFRDIAVNIAHYHHERWDGKGYPAGLSGEAIPFEARVMALADVFDALVSKRVYKEAFGFDRAFAIIQEGSGSQFDPRLVPLFMECRPDLEQLYLGYEE